MKLILHMATNDLDFSLYFVFKNLLFFFFSKSVFEKS